MGWLETYKSAPDQKGNPNPPPITPRLSFSNDFVQSEPHRPMPVQNVSPSAAAAATDDDFEFSAVTNQNGTTMSAADDLFFKGKLLPTLRDELLLDLDDDDDRVSSFVPPKGLPKWKHFLTFNRPAVDAPRCAPKNNNNPTPPSVNLNS